MKFFQSSSSETQISNFKPPGNCLPGALRRLPCFYSHATNHHIKSLTEPFVGKTEPGIVARLMGLDSMPQRIPLIENKDHNGNTNSQSHLISHSPMVLEIKKGKFFVLGFEAGCKGKGRSRSDSKTKLEEEDEAKKKKLVTETSKANAVFKDTANADFELEFLDQLVLELVYVF